jgi:hypothetical protein
MEAHPELSCNLRPSRRAVTPHFCGTNESTTTRDGSSCHPSWEGSSRRAKTAFAAACAQRLLPLFGRYASMAGVTAHAQRLAGILAAAWDVASERAIDVRSMDSEVEV